MISWHGRTPDNYVTKGGEVVRLPGGWFARAGTRARGPLRSLDDAMDACVEMIAQQRQDCRAEQGAIVFGQTSSAKRQ